MPNVNPKQTLNTDVRTKYIIVRTATLPFLLMSKLAAPEKYFEIKSYTAMEITYFSDILIKIYIKIHLFASASIENYTNGYY